MGIFDIVSFLTPFFTGHGVPHLAAEADAWIKERGEDYPDAKARADALRAFLSEKVAAAGLDAEGMKATLTGLAEDVVRGHGGVDPQVWQGGV